MRVISIFLLFFALNALASTKTISASEFAEIEDRYALEANVPYPIWNVGHSVCEARTLCPNGQVAYCKTFATSMAGPYSRSASTCRWMVLPGRAVRCQGQALKRDYYGRPYWAYVDVPVRCF